MIRHVVAAILSTTALSTSAQVPPPPGRPICREEAPGVALAQIAKFANQTIQLREGDFAPVPVNVTCVGRDGVVLERAGTAFPTGAFLVIPAARILAFSWKADDGRQLPLLLIAPASPALPISTALVCAGGPDCRVAVGTCKAEEPFGIVPTTFVANQSDLTGAQCVSARCARHYAQYGYQVLSCYPACTYARRRVEPGPPSVAPPACPPGP